MFFASILNHAVTFGDLLKWVVAPALVVCTIFGAIFWVLAHTDFSK